MLGGDEEFVREFVAVVEGNIAVGWFGSPNFWWHGDGEGRCAVRIEI